MKGGREKFRPLTLIKGCFIIPFDGSLIRGKGFSALDLKRRKNCLKNQMILDRFTGDSGQFVDKKVLSWIKICCYESNIWEIKIARNPVK